MGRGLLRWQVALWLLLWTAGVLAVWVTVRVALDPDVKDEDIQECIGEGIIPPEECEAMLQELQGEPFVAGVPLLVIVWFAGLLLFSVVWLARRHPPANEL
jgi:hypothetical protein